MGKLDVFKTDIPTHKKAKVVLSVLSETFPSYRINVDLEDCDKILRVQGKGVEPAQIIALLKTNGYQCEAL